jgi:hypothetical protein
MADEGGNFWIGLHRGDFISSWKRWAIAFDFNETEKAKWFFFISAKLVPSP